MATAISAPALRPRRVTSFVASTPGRVADALRGRKAGTLAPMRIFVLGAGQVGSTIVESLHGEHAITVIDLDPLKLDALSYRYDIVTVVGNGASRRVLQESGVAQADLFIACTSRDESNIIAAIFSRRLAPKAKVIVRTSNVEYFEIWHENQLDVDFIVSSEQETALAVSRAIGVPAARQTDVFADGQVQIVEFDIDQETSRRVVNRPLRQAHLPADSKIASIIRGERAILPTGDDTIVHGDRIVVIGSPQAATEWSRLIASDSGPVKDVVIFGAGRTGAAVAHLLLQQGIGVSLVEPNAERAREIAVELPDARVFRTAGLDSDFLERERIGNTHAAIFAMRDDAKNLYAATLARVHGVGFTIAIAHELASIQVFEQAGVDLIINPRSLTAEEIVRFAYDPRTTQVAMLEGDRYEVLDIIVRAESAFVNKSFRELPLTNGALIGAIVRNGQAIFPHGSDRLLPGDRAIIFIEADRATAIEQML
jgi:trk system potassium uptake protein TrkA